MVDFWVFMWVLEGNELLNDVIDEVIGCKLKGYDFVIDCIICQLVVFCYMSVIGG